jgi:hypothetical protein
MSTTKESGFEGPLPSSIKPIGFAAIGVAAATEKRFVKA